MIAPKAMDHSLPRVLIVDDSAVARAALADVPEPPRVVGVKRCAAWEGGACAGAGRWVG